MNTIRQHTIFLLTALFALLFLGACRSPNEGASPKDPQKKWGVSVGERIQSKPAVGADGTVYVGVSNQHLYAFRSSGHFLWKYKTTGIVLSPSVSPSGAVVATTSDGYVFALDSFGKKLWAHRPRRRLFGCPPAISPNGVVFVAGDLVLTGITIKDGKAYNISSKMPLIKTCPVVNNKGQLFYSNGVYLYGFDVAAKKQVVKIPLKRRLAGPVFDKAGNLYVATARGEILSYTDKGKKRWEFKATARKATKFTRYDFLWPHVAPNGDIIVIRRNEGIYALTPKGTRKWFFAQPSKTFSGRLSIAPNGTIFATSRDSQLYAFSPEGKVRFRFRTNDWALFGSTLSKDGKTLYFGSFDKHLYAIHTQIRAK